MAAHFQAHRSSTATAPGKAILFGEHAVVYGFTAIAACASDLRVRVDVAPCSSPGLHAAFAGGVSQSVDAAALLGALQTSGCDAGEALTRAPARPSAALCAALSALVTVQDPSIVQALVPLLFLSASILLRRGSGSSRGSGASPGLRLSVRSEGLPIGAGLGSSAAVSVAAAAALLRAAGAIGQGTAVVVAGSSGRRPDAAALELINGWAYASEVIFHGTPSGIDNSVSTHGGMVTFTKGEGMKRLARPAAAPPLRVLVTNTRVPRSTSALVGAVRELRAALPHVTNRIFDAIEAVVAESLAVLRGGGDSLAELARLMTINHSLLQAVGVSHPALEEVCAAMGAAGLAGTKLTGAGGGGCAITLLVEGGPSPQPACAALEARGYECFETELGGEGVLLLLGGGEEGAAAQSKL
tara:strand:- start:202 stop:1440 length:1239 start_codon:yes stop_codon:yes gene_type:complete